MRKHQALPTVAGAAQFADRGAGSGAVRTAGAVGAAGTAASRKKKDFILKQKGECFSLLFPYDFYLIMLLQQNNTHQPLP